MRIYKTIKRHMPSVKRFQSKFQPQKIYYQPFFLKIMCVNRGPENARKLRSFGTLYAHPRSENRRLFFHLFTSQSFDPSWLLSDVYSECFRIMFPENLTQF